MVSTPKYIVFPYLVLSFPDLHLLYSSVSFPSSLLLFLEGI